MTSVTPPVDGENAVVEEPAQAADYQEAPPPRSANGPEQASHDVPTVAAPASERPAGRRGGREREGERGDRGESGRRGERGRGRRLRRRVCAFCVDKVSHIDYKEHGRLRDFVSDRGKILKSRMTGTCARHQRTLTQAIKRARQVALLPFVSE